MARLIALPLVIGLAAAVPTVQAAPVPPLSAGATRAIGNLVQTTSNLRGPSSVLDLLDRCWAGVSTLSGAVVCNAHQIAANVAARSTVEVWEQRRVLSKHLPRLNAVLPKHWIDGVTEATKKRLIDLEAGMLAGTPRPAPKPASRVVRHMCGYYSCW